MRRIALGGPTRAARSLIKRLFVLGVLWWAITEGEAAFSVAALVVVVSATAVSLVLLPPGGARPTVRGVLAFTPYFLLQSIRGGVDVARRALDPRLPILPGFLEHPFRLPPGAPRTFFIVALSLLPGTLSVRVRKDHLQVHLLDRTRPARRWIARFEERVATLFGIRI